MSIEVNQRLLEIFGIKGHRVTELALQAKAGEPARLTVTRLLINARELQQLTQQFELLPHVEPDDAMQRVQAFIDEAADEAVAQLTRDHRDACRRLLRASRWAPRHQGRAEA